MAKPTQDPKWVTTDDPVNIIEPTAGAKLNGITSGGIWARENLNWMFNTISKWIDWVRDNVRSNTENDARYVQHTAVVNNVTSTSATDPLSANQGKVLKDLADSNYTTITNKFGTGASQVQTNAQNASEFVSHSEVINTLTSTSTTNPASANQVKVLKGLVDSNNTNTNARIGSTTASNVRNNSQLDAHYLLESSNLSDLTNPAVAIDNLGLRDNTENDARYLLESNNLSDLTSVATAVDNLGLRDNTENDARFNQSSTNVSGFNRVSNVYVSDFLQGISSIDIPDDGVQYSVGPTGSGADIILPTMDSIPVGAQYVEIKVTAACQLAAGQSTGQLICRFYPTVTANAVFLTEVRMSADQSHGYRTQALYKIPLRAGNIFVVRADSAGTASGNECLISVQGFGI